jgi:predicted MFS family arabinose efflux permease
VCAIVALSAFPMIVIGALAVLFERDGGFRTFEPGIAVGVFFVAGACTAYAGGSLAEVVGARLALRVGAVTTSSVLLAMGAFAQTSWHVYALMAIAGGANGVTQPATNLAISGPSNRQGLLFGIRYSSIPVAAVVAGVAVPVLGLDWGWRVLLLAGGSAGLVVGVVLPRFVPAGGEARRLAGVPRGLDSTRRSLIALSLAGGLATSTVTAFAAYVVFGAVEAGLSVSAAGWLLATCGIGGITSRIFAGLIVDATAFPMLPMMSAMLSIGAFGYLLMAVGAPGQYVLGAVVVNVFGWGWTALLNLSVIRLNPRSPGAASGLLGTGVIVGGAAGPAVFGLLAALIGPRHGRRGGTVRTSRPAQLAPVVPGGPVRRAAGRLRR